METHELQLRAQTAPIPMNDVDSSKLSEDFGYDPDTQTLALPLGLALPLSV